MYFVYIIECRDGSLYTGITTDLERRLLEHKDGIGGNYTRAKGAKRIVYSEECKDRSSALKREARIKKMTRKDKFDLVKSAN